MRAGPDPCLDDREHWVRCRDCGWEAQAAVLLSIEDCPKCGSGELEGFVPDSSGLYTATVRNIEPDVPGGRPIHVTFDLAFRHGGGGWICLRGPGAWFGWENGVFSHNDHPGTRRFNLQQGLQIYRSSKAITWSTGDNANRPVTLRVGQRFEFYEDRVEVFQPKEHDERRNAESPSASGEGRSVAHGQADAEERPTEPPAPAQRVEVLAGTTKCPSLSQGATGGRVESPALEQQQNAGQCPARGQEPTGGAEDLLASRGGTGSPVEPGVLGRVLAPIRTPSATAGSPECQEGADQPAAGESPALFVYPDGYGFFTGPVAQTAEHRRASTDRPTAPGANRFLGRGVSPACETPGGSGFESRPAPTNLSAEPPYPGLETVLFSLRSPETTGHLATDECQREEPHPIAECPLWRGPTLAPRFAVLGGGTRCPDGEPHGGDSREPDRCRRCDAPLIPLGPTGPFPGRPRLERRPGYRGPLLGPPDPADQPLPRLGAAASRPRMITVTAELSLRRSEGQSARFELRAQTSTPSGPVRLLRGELDPHNFAQLVSGATVVCQVEVPDWGEGNSGVERRGEVRG